MLGWIINIDPMNNIFNEQCQDEQCFLNLLVALIL